jgi:CheY-like chemotaxis protein
MKLLIIAGPYEADRIRKAAVTAGFETLAVEPGESLSGWITASRPDLIVMAPQIVHPDPALALAKVRTVPRGRVPIFLVGDAAEEDRMRSLAEGFFVRPIAPDLLLARARAILTPPAGSAAPAPDFERTEMGLGAAGVPRPTSRPQPDLERTEMGLGAGAGLKPLVAAALATAPVAPARAADPGRLLAELGAGIDALLDAELQALLGSATAAAPAPPSGDFAGETTRKADPALLAEAARPSRKKRGQKPGRTTPGMPSAPPVAPRPPEAPRDRVLRRHALVEQGDYFAVLGVGRDAGADELRRAHAAILNETEIPPLDEATAAELADRIADLRVVAGEALRILTDESLRARYAAHLPS